MQRVSKNKSETYQKRITGENHSQEECPKSIKLISKYISKTYHKRTMESGPNSESIKTISNTYQKHIITEEPAQKECPKCIANKSKTYQKRIMRRSPQIASIQKVSKTYRKQYHGVARPLTGEKSN